MKRIAIFSLAVLTGSFVVAAQAPAAQPDSSRMDTGCPVSMRAQQKGMGDLLLADRGREGKVVGPAQRIHLTLGKGTETSEEIARVRVTVHGTGAENRMYRVPAGQADSRGGGGDFLMGPKADRARSFDLAFRPNGDGEIATDLVLRGFTSVTWINLDSVTFADGAVWMPGGKLNCRISPDLLMLIARQ
jgi:hypothetical protein